MREIKVFGIGSTKAIAEAVCYKIGIELSPLNEEKFPDGELKVCPSVSVANADVFVFHSLGEDNTRSVNDRLCELCFFVSTLKDHGAKRVTAMIPYLAYARSDQRKIPFDSVTHRYVAQMLEASGVDRVFALDVHNISAFENTFRCRSLNLEAASLFCQYVAPYISKEIPPVVLSPDIGGIKRAEQFRKILESTLGVPVGSAFLEKFREKNEMSGQRLVGDLIDRSVFIVDDMISTGETILRALKACQHEGAATIKVFATHGIFSKNQNELLNFPSVDEFIVTDSHPALKKLTSYKKLKTLSCASLFASAISMEDTHENFSVWRHNDRTGD